MKALRHGNFPVWCDVSLMLVVAAFRFGTPVTSWRLKVGLHYSYYHSKLVPFEEQKNIFYILKRP
jgi:hypothetical protein